MSYSKRQIIEQAFETLGYADYSFDLEPERFESALKRLDAMLASWDGKIIRLSYPIPSSPENSDLRDESGLPDYANEAVILNLALRLATTIGKVVSNELKAQAKQAYDTVVNRAVSLHQRQFPCQTLAGAGNKRYVYLPPPNDDPLRNDENGNLQFIDN